MKILEWQKSGNLPVMRLPSRRALNDTRGPTLIARSGTSSCYAKVLVAIDATSDHAALIEETCRVASHANLVLLNVLRCSLDDRLRYFDASEEKLRKVQAQLDEEALDRLTSIVKASALQSSRVTTIVEHGDMADVVLKLVQDLNIDLAVIGTRRTTALSRFFLRNGAWEIVNKATCDVLAVPNNSVFSPNSSWL